MIGKIVEFKRLPDETTGLGKGIVIDLLQDPNPDASIYTVATVSGHVIDCTRVMFDVCESDALAMIELPAYPPIKSDEDAIEAAKQWALIGAILANNAAAILAIEQDIQRQQDELAARIRGQNAALYAAQQVVGKVYYSHEKRNHEGAIALWESKGRPEKGKRFGGVQIEEKSYWTHYDSAAALAFCQTQAPNMVITEVDETRFKKAVLDGVLKNVPATVCKAEKHAITKTLAKRLAELADGAE